MILASKQNELSRLPGIFLILGNNLKIRKGGGRNRSTAIKNYLEVFFVVVGF